jgi:hypothetical protein
LGKGSKNSLIVNYAFVLLVCSIISELICLIYAAKVELMSVKLHKKLRAVPEKNWEQLFFYVRPAWAITWL